MSKSKIAVLSADLGGFDKGIDNTPQSIPCDYFKFTDSNFSPRSKSMTPRLQSKIPKCFGWQMIAGYDYYLWLDGNFALAREDSLQYLLDKCQGYDMIVFRHPTRPDIRQEVRYTRKSIKQLSNYAVGRYQGELLRDQYQAIIRDKDYIDDLLLCGGVFMYKNTPEVQRALKEWWYNISRYIVQDQISFPYAIKHLKLNILDENIYNTPYLKSMKHIYHAK